MARVSAVILMLLSAATAAQDDDRVEHFVDDRSERMPINTVAPAYPAKAQRARLEGDVQVCFNIDKHGRPHRIAVRRSTNRVFEKPAIRAIRASSFAKLGPDEIPSGIKTCRTFFFRLEPVQRI